MTPLHQQANRGLAVRAGWMLLVPCGLLLLSACQQKMANAPYFRPLEQSEFFEDGRASRPQEPGTVSRSRVPEDNALVTGLTPAGRKSALKKLAGAEELALAGAPSSVDNFVSVFPFKVTEEDLHRGMERFTIYCTPCHSPAGDGNGKIVERGYLKPTNYHFEKANRGEDEKESTKGLARGFGRFGLKVAMSPVDPRRADGMPIAPVGYYFEVISKGFGGMPEHASQIPDPYDRWCIVAYIRVLQLSRSINVKDLPEPIRAGAVSEADKTLEKTTSPNVSGGHP